MILSVSRRTDIPALYSDWFFNRMKDGFVLVRNPMNPRQISRIAINPETVDGIVFWTKNPSPMLRRLQTLDAYPYYVQFTLTAYGSDVEPGIASKSRVVLPAFRRLSREIGRDRVIWRYDPIFFNAKYTPEYHCRHFQALAERLSGYTERCTISFLDRYRKTVKNMRPLQVRAETQAEQMQLAERLAAIAGACGMTVDTCAEPIDLSRYGISHARCIDPQRLEEIGGFRLRVGKDPNQRAACGCAASVDIGAYHTCGYGCLYCYASENPAAAMRNARRHDPRSPLLFGEIGPEDVVKERKTESCRLPAQP